jgi:hypothetical protein
MKTKNDPIINGTTSPIVDNIAQDSVPQYFLFPRNSFAFNPNLDSATVLDKDRNIKKIDFYF